MKVCLFHQKNRSLTLKGGGGWLGFFFLFAVFNFLDLFLLSGHEFVEAGALPALKNDIFNCEN